MPRARTLKSRINNIRRLAVSDASVGARCVWRTAWKEASFDVVVLKGAVGNLVVHGPAAWLIVHGAILHAAVVHLDIAGAAAAGAICDCKSAPKPWRCACADVVVLVAV